MEKGKIIILNGVSSSGKSTLAKVLQDCSPIPLYKLDIDDFILMAPDKFNDHEKNNFSVQYALASKFFHVVKLISDFGLSIVAPYMFFKNSDTLREFKQLLDGYPVFVVNVPYRRTPEKREDKRKQSDRQCRSSAAATGNKF